MKKGCFESRYHFNIFSILRTPHSFSVETRLGLKTKERRGQLVPEIIHINIPIEDVFAHSGESL